MKRQVIDGQTGESHEEDLTQEEIEQNAKDLAQVQEGQTYE